MSRIKFTFLPVLLIISFVHFTYGQGSRYTGTYTKSSPIKYDGKSNIIIEGVEIFGDGVDAINLTNCDNVIIKNSKLRSSNSSSKRGVYLYNCKNVTIMDCTFENVRSGLVASTSQGIKFEYNDVTNVVGTLYSSGDNGSMVQFIKVSGAGNSISYNACENFAGKSAPEDLVNIFSSNGTSSSPILVKGNYIRGGGPSNSGGGINLGDLGGSYQIAEDNILVDSGQYGIAISGGNNMTLRNNKVYGKRQSFTNVGMIVTNWYENEAGPSFNITSSNNRINFFHADGYANNWWIPSSKNPVEGKSTNVGDKSLSASILPEKIIGRAQENTPPTPPEVTPPETPEVTPPETPDVTPPTDGGGGNNGGEDPGKGPDANPDDDIYDPSITIYLDNFRRICVNYKGRITKGANVTVYNLKGDKLYSQSLRGYHTVIRKRFGRGTYQVKVQNGSKLQNKEIIIK